jgi:hypothetical protein
MTIIRLRPGVVPAADTKLPTWASVFPLLIQPNKLLIGDDLKGATVPLNNAAPILNATGSAKLWTAPAFNKNTDGAARTSITGTQFAVIDCGLANHRVLATFAGLTLTGDNPALIFRYVDTTNYWRVSLDIQNGISRLAKVVAGTVTNIFSAGPLTTGASYEVRCDGANNITVYCNGILVTTTNDAANAAGTKVGFSCISNASPSRVTNFQAGSL